MIFDDGIFPEDLGPPKVCLTEDSSEDTTTDPQEDEDDIVDGVVVDAIVCLEQNELSRGRGVELFEGDGCDERAKEGFPQYGTGKVRADFLRSKGKPL